MKIPAGVTSIGTSAFSGCSAMRFLIFKGTPSTITTTSFSGCDQLKLIKVPWAEGAVKNAPWGATNAEIWYEWDEEAENNRREITFSYSTPVVTTCTAREGMTWFEFVYSEYNTHGFVVNSDGKVRLNGVSVGKTESTPVATTDVIEEGVNYWCGN
jgi:hypothetical protein